MLDYGHGRSGGRDQGDPIASTYTEMCGLARQRR
jgi:hypothetical protein